MHMMFNFQVNQNLFYALATADTRPLARAMLKTKKRPASGQWGVFLRNHDELDFGRLTEKQRQRVFAAIRRTSFTTAASGDASRRCWAATGGGWSLPTA
jgi:hypothetical protein